MDHPGARPARLAPYVVLLEDDDLLAELLERSLVRCGCSVQRFACAEDAEELLDSDRTSVLVSDVRLSGPMSGLELVERLRARGDARPAVLMSGLHDADEERAALAAGVEAVLQKPFPLAALTEAVERLLSAGATDTAPGPN